MTEINLLGLYSDETEYFHAPLEPKSGDVVKLRFRTALDDVDEVLLVSRDRKIRMEKETSTEVFDYYMTKIVAENEMIRYYFEVRKGAETLIYNRRGVFEDTRENYQFAIVPDFETPDWAKGAVMYQIYTDRFCNGDPSNDVESGEYFYLGHPVKKVDDWEQKPSDLDVGNFYGGDLEGVKKKLDYLQHLGIEVLYFNPLFVSPSNHKYDCQDYEHIDPHLTVIRHDSGAVLPEGCMENCRAEKYIARTADLENLEASDAYFAEFCEELHRRGMKIIVDGVFNHCGSFNKWMDRERIYEGQEDFAKGAYVDRESPYRSFFDFKEDQWPYNRSYDGWWANDTLPKLNYEASPALEDYIIEIGKKWISPPYNVDGWRLDVAADLGHSPEYNHHFWKRFRKEIKAVNPEVMIYAEHYGDAGSWLQGDQWDTVMNYDAFMEPLTWFVTGMEKHSDEYKGEYHRNSRFFCDSISHFMTAFHMPSLMTAMNQLSNHDHSRFLTRTNHVKGRLQTHGSEAAEQGVDKSLLEIAVAFQMTWIGAPTLYYGDEAGVCGFTDPDNRRTYPWGHEDFELIDFHREMIAIHKRNPVLKTGATKMFDIGEEMLAFARFDDQAQMLTVINLSDEGKTIHVPVWAANVSLNGTMERLMKITKTRYNVGKIPYSVKEGILELYLEAGACKVFRSVPDQE